MDRNYEDSFNNLLGNMPPSIYEDQEPVKKRGNKFENEPIYACSTITWENHRIKEIYNSILKTLMSGVRKSYFQYSPGMSIHSEDITDEEKKQILEITGPLLQQKELSYASCYIDMLGEMSVNYGLYLSDSDQLHKFEEKLAEDLNISFIADIQHTGKYIVRGKTRESVGHEKAAPHLENGILMFQEKRDGDIE